VAPFDTRLGRLATIATELELPTVAADAETFAARIAEGRFYVACVGQFKRGKSTLLNALIEDSILPTGVTPVTSVVTVIRHGDSRGAHVRLGPSQGWVDIEPQDLAEYVTEARNPENTKRVAAVEVFVSSPLLASGMCLVDTPGIGSVFGENTTATRDFLPHVDAALVVIGADPPITADELSLVIEVTEHVDHVMVVLNKADRLPDRDRAEAAAFSLRILQERLGRPVGHVWQVSATDRLAGTGPSRDWDALVRALTDLADTSGAGLVRAAESRGLRVLTSRVQRELDERRAALIRPLEESEARVRALDSIVDDADRWLLDLRHLLLADEECLHEAFTTHQATFVARVLPAARVELLEAIRGLPPQRIGQRRDQSFRSARNITKALLDGWRATEQPTAQELYRETMARFHERAAGFVERLRALDAPVPLLTAIDRGLRVPSRLFYTHLMYLTTRSPFRWIRDLARSRTQLTDMVEGDACDYLELLLRTNAQRLVNDLLKQVAESRRALEAELRNELSSLKASASRALDRARGQRGRGVDAARQELARLDEMQVQLGAISIRS
jgi:GTP-binding protein EngB required for normal cell division